MSLLSLIRQIVALLLIQTLSLAVRAQGPVFVAYYSAGNIKCSPTHGGSHPLDYHNWLFEADRLSLQDNIAELILFDRDSNYLRLDGKGNYPVSELEKMPRHRITDSVAIHYLSILWTTAPRPRTPPRTSPPPAPAVKGSPTHHSPQVNPQPGSHLVIGPGNGYTTSLDSCIFRWHPVNWARKYFLRMRTREGEIRYDSVLVDSDAVVNFAGRMPPDTYFWALDLVGESGRLQFGDSGHITLIDETPVLPLLPPLPEDSIGGVIAVLRKIAQYEAAGCTRSAAAMFVQLSLEFPTDAALDKMYQAFLVRNGLL